MAGVTRRQAALAGLLGGAAMLPAWAASVPAVLSQAALPTPKALGAATLAVARAGDRLVAVGERGTVLLSDDHGASWRQAQVPVQASLAAVCFADARTGWAAGHLGVILRSDDAGASWHKQLDGVQAAELVKQAAQRSGDAKAMAQAERLVEEGADKPFFDLEFLDAQRGFAVGAYNLMFATDDGGKSWAALGPRLPNPKSLHLYGVRARGRTLVVAGEQGLLLRSTDGGASFSALASPYKGSFFGLLQTRGGALVAYGLRGTAWRSGDEGQHWDKLDTGLPMAVGAGTALPNGGFVLLGQAGDALLGGADGPALRRIPAREPVPVSGVALAADGALVLASLRGMRRVELPAH
ncbi:BNR/Asp-box repeat protein [Polaromonas sp. CF318]|uniref:WD40/YVTN/BNR-like repeat-containing protein n=1 Tax=Polaromonas sp. CF318 TaxID=1144318 RepID=UPI0002714CB7|nr:YCF48-related protein [Polaromonas sp. CF318]EJL78835.1 BNR/Asp-box repeat protein [Polaromonas sp. CF318]